MKTRSIIDSPTELDARATALIDIVDGMDWSNAFMRQRIKQMVIDAQLAAGERMAANLTVSMQRLWIVPDAVPAASEKETA